MSADDEWETQLDAGTLSLLTLKDEAPSSNQQTPFPQSTHQKVEKSGKAGSAPIRSFDDILGSANEPFTKQKKEGPRPETTTVVARRFLAHALHKPEIIKREEEAQLAKRREEKKQERVERRKELDAVWEDN